LYLYVDRSPIGQVKYAGRQENKELQEKIELLLNEGKSYTMIVRLLGCARGTIAKVSRRIKESKD
jgi:DNA invertase Pin-like site-specific DNA recombinase